MIAKGSEFDNFDDFFNWYIAIIASLVPDYSMIPHEEVHRQIPKMTASEIEDLSKTVRELQPLPKGVELICDDSAGTFYSTFHNGKVLIAYPTIMRYWVRYPNIIKAAIQHEFGHILNGDIYQPIVDGHKSCTNKCMDIRINQNLNKDSFNQVYCCLMEFKNKIVDWAFTPENYFPKLGLPLASKNKIGWLAIHQAWHEVYGDSEDLPLKIGDYTVTLKEVNGFPVCTFGIVVANDKATSTYAIHRLIDSVQSAWKEENYISIAKIFNSFGLRDYKNGEMIIANNKLSQLTTGLLGDGLEFKKDFLRAIPPTEKDTLPRIGDFVFTTNDIGAFKAGTYGQVVSFGTVSSHTAMDENAEDAGAPYIVAPLTDEFSKIFKKRDFPAFQEKIITEKLTQDTTFDANFPNDMVVVKPPSKDSEIKDDREPDTDSTNPPKIGDVVYVKKGAKKHSYGILQKIEEDFTFAINEITKEQAMEILKSKL